MTSLKDLDFATLPLDENIPEDQRDQYRASLALQREECAQVLYVELGMAGTHYVDQIKESATQAALDVINLQPVMHWFFRGGSPGQALECVFSKESTLSGVPPKEVLRMRAPYMPIQGQMLTSDGFAHHLALYSLAMSPVVRAKLYFMGLRLRWVVVNLDGSSEEE